MDSQGRISYVHWAAIQLTHYEGPSSKSFGRHPESYRVGGAYAAAVVASGYAARGVSSPREALLDGNAAREQERADQAELIRHFFGDPFRPSDGRAAWPQPVLALAASLYDGHDVAFALHDALLDAGHAELAEHFRETEHPKGCWATDLILGKK